MYSFYGGQRGQDFKITRVFSNRSEDLLADLQARWFSPVNVGDYVFISYGDIAEQNKTFINQNGVSTEVSGDYETNLDIDLKNCGKSYSNSLWQKIYVDQNKTLSPDQPIFDDDDNNVYVFINFEDSIETITNVVYDSLSEEEKIKYKSTFDENGNAIWIRHKDDKLISSDGDVIDTSGELVQYRQVPGHSLRECSSIYTEEEYGFGYRLICCLTGQTPRIEVFHEVIEIDDGPPYVSCDISNLERPKIKFYLQKAQTLRDFVSTITVPPTENPDVDLMTKGLVDVTFNVNDIIADEHYNLIKYQFEEYNKTVDLDIDKYDIASYFKNTYNGMQLVKKLPSFVSIQIEATLAHPILHFELPRAVRFFNGYLFGQGNLSDYPFFIAFEPYWERAGNFTIKYKKYWQVSKVAAAVIEGITTEGFSVINDTLNTKLFKEGFVKRVLQEADGLAPYYHTNESLVNFLGASSINKDLIPWDIYGLAEEDINSDETITQYCNRMSEAYEKIIAEAEKYIVDQAYTLSLDEYWGKYGLPTKAIFDSLLLNKERVTFFKNYIHGLTTVGSLVPVVELIDLYSSIMSFKHTLIEILTTDKEIYHFGETHARYFLEIAKQLMYSHSHYKHVLHNALPGDIYIHVPTGRLYQFTKIVTDKEPYSLTALYLGAMTAPAPEITSTTQPTFIKDENGVYHLNSIKVRDNILISYNEQGYREAYIFDIPDSPEYQVSYDDVNYQTPPSVELSVVQDKNDLDDGIYNFHFNLPREPLFEARYETILNEKPPFVESHPVLGTDSDTIYLDFDLPRAVHMYTDEYLPIGGEITGFNNSGEGNPITTITTSNDNLSKGDIYLYTAYVETKEGIPQYNMLDRYRGFVYTYNGNGTWERQGSLLGSIGVPKTTKTIRFVRNEELNKGEVIRVLNDDGTLSHYEFSWEDNLTDIINQYNITDGVPDSLIGEAYIFQIDFKDNNGNLIMDETWWGQYYDSNWSMSLITGQSNLLDAYEGDEQIAKGNTYTANYLNSILQWDTDNYY